ncbi:MAG: bifunctional oligoribonuclease/PAP phosphatase NrnA [Patescibacteria group bacterium]|jgi:phosphoesterase RecJ-like protein
MEQHYPLSKSILEEITKAQNILINVHRNPDLDSIGSATAMYQALIKMGKKVALVCPHEIPENFKFLKGADLVQTIDFKTWADTEVRPYDLFLILDSGSYDVVTGSKEIRLPNIKKIVIDHHRTNNFTDVNIILYDELAATCEIIYQMFVDWGIEIDPNMATSLFSGIAGDTVFFKYGENTKLSFKIAMKLLDLGADKNKLIEQAFDSFDFDLVKTMGEFLGKMEKGNGFVYSIMDHKTFIKFGKHRGARETVANLFARSIKGFDFGIMAVEYEIGKFAVSFRSKKNTDVSVIAKKFGGGGHKNAAGATIYGTIDQVTRKIKEII